MQEVDTCSLKEFECVAEMHVPPIYMSSPKVYQKHLIPKNLQDRSQSRWDTKRIVTPDLKIYRLKDVFVMVEGLVFTRSGTLVAETITQHSERDIKLAFDELTTNLACSVPVASHPKGILCKKRGAENYGHWLVEMLPKAFWATKELGLDADWPAVIHETSGRLKESVAESLDCIGFGTARVISTTRTACHFDELLVVNGLTQHTVFMSPLVFECMEFIAGKAAVNSDESLYITRRSAKSRSFENEEEVSGFFAQQGYKSIDCGELSFLEQVSAFKSARRLAGPMGAAFTNAVFSQPDTEMLMFMPASAQEYFFWHISEGKKLNYHEVRCAESGPQRAALPWSRDIYISSQSLDTLIQHIDNAHKIDQCLRDDTEQELEVDLIKDKTWLLSFSHSPDKRHEIHFDASGSISIYRYQNEKFWRIRNKEFQILDLNGRISWNFTPNFKGGNLDSLSGTFQLSNEGNIKSTLLPCFSIK